MHWGILFLRSSYHYLFKNIALVRSICKFDPNCICVVVFVYLHVRHSGTLFLRSSYHYLFKNITHVKTICIFDRNCICVFLYLYLCICTSDTWEHCFWGPCIITFQKIYGLYGPKPCTMEKRWDVTPVTDTLTDRHRKVEQYSAEAESAIQYIQ